MEIFNKAESLVLIGIEIAKITVNTRRAVARFYYEAMSLGGVRDEQAWKDILDSYSEGLHMGGEIPKDPKKREKLHQYVKNLYELYEMANNPDKVENTKKNAKSLIEQIKTELT